MIKYYCKKCNLDNDGPMCMNCGKKLSGSTMHSVWAIRRLPLTDDGVWLGALGIASLVVLILFLLIFGAEFFLTGTEKMMALLNSNLPMIVMAILPLSLLLTALLLTLQGHEVLFYSLENYGVILRTWHGASRLKCWARLMGAKLDQVMEDENGQGVIMGHERITLWKDVRQVRYNPRRAEIKLYHANRIAPMVLRIPQEEYPATETLIKKFCKNK